MEYRISIKEQGSPNGILNIEQRTRKSEWNIEYRAKNKEDRMEYRILIKEQGSKNRISNID